MFARSGVISRKKLLALGAVLLLSAGTGQPVHADEGPTPFRLGSRFNRKLQNYTGINRLTGFVVSEAVTFGLWLKFHGKVKAKVRTYSLTDLLSGKIKGVDISLKDCSYRRVPFGDLELSSATPIWLRYFKWHGQKAGLASPILVRVKGNVSGEDVAAGLASPAVSQSLKSIKLDLPGLGGQQLQFLDPRVSLRAEEIKISSILITAGARRETGVPIEIVGKPELVAQSKIFVRDLQVDSPDIPNPKEFAQFTSTLLNPLIDFARMDRSTHAFRLESLKVLDDKVHFNGNLVLAPRFTPQMVAQQVGKK